MKALALTLALALALSAPALSQFSQHVLFHFPSAGQPFAYGGLGDEAGDVNGDGFTDFLIGAYYQAEVRSGFDGSLLHSWSTSNPPHELAGAGDVNGDGYDDVMIADGPIVDIRSGLDGSVLHHVIQGGSVIEGVGDVDGDGFDDFFVGSPGGSTPPGTMGWCFTFFAGEGRVYSGATGTVIRQWTGGAGEGFPSHVASYPDMDGDGNPEILLCGDGFEPLGYGSSPWCVIPSPVAARVEVVSPLTGVVFTSFLSWPVWMRANPLGDVNGDGVTDMIMSAVGHSGSWTTGVLSGTDASFLAVRSETALGSPYCASVGDYDGDGLNDAFLPGPMGSASLRVLSGANLSTLATFSSPWLATVYYGSDLTGGGVAEFMVGAQDGFRVASINPLPAAGMTSLGVGCGAGAILPPTLSGSAPVLGGQVSWSVGAAEPSRPGVLLLSAGPAPTPGTGCGWFIDWNTAVPLAFFTTDSQGAWSLSIPLPRAPLWSGLQFATQAVVWSTAGGTSSNGVDLQLGF